MLPKMRSKMPWAEAGVRQATLSRPAAKTPAETDKILLLPRADIACPCG
jgi:hypothetical protein